MTVAYKLNAIDSWHSLIYLCSKTLTGKAMALFLLALPWLALTVQWYFTKPNSREEHFLVHYFWIIAGGIYIVLAFSFVWSSVLAAFILPREKVAINEKGFLREQLVGLLTIKSQWHQFASVVEEQEYILFIGWRRFVCVPKRAFNSYAEAEAFFDLAVGYWRQAKGLPSLPVSDTTGVWPPPPTAGAGKER